MRQLLSLSGHNPIYGYFDTYLSAVNNAGPAATLTIEEVLGSTDAMDTFATGLPESELQQLATNLNNLTTAITGNNGMVEELYTQLTAQVADSSDGGTSTTFNLGSLLDGYNESLMNVYAALIQGLQMTYTIQYTFLQIAYQDPSLYPNWDIGMSELLNSQTLEENISALDQYYQTAYQDAFNAVSAKIISDDFTQITNLSDLPSGMNAITYQPGYYPTKANTLTGMPAAWMASFSNATPWTQACDLYVYAGVSTSEQTSYTGQFSSGTLVAQCAAGSTMSPVSLNLSSVASGAQLNYYYGPGINSTNVPWLQPSTLSSDYLKEIMDPTTFNKEIGYAQLEYSSLDTYSIGIDAGWNNPPSIYPIASGGNNVNTDGWPWVMGIGTNWVIAQYVSSMGLVQQLWVGAVSEWGQYVQLQGGNNFNAQLVYQEAGFDYGNALCIGGDTVQISSNGTSGNSATMTPIPKGCL